ncbi:hypothetical protein [Lignipirellula cremea]|uniref:Uncharacterized protein n=1 Tax=Lignipirellula cremea TaxID=2528010 RepID=A0A518E4T9_9BACT|nr:hypothetical protein [Lignipirellula cremea]QDU99110.1 hypothetical protein Pla8534_70210 [Lignipirellula cremea]
MQRNPMRWLAASLAFLSMCASVGAASAMWAPAPLEVLADEADLIIAGRVTAVGPAGFALFNRPQDLATIEVLRVLKSLPGVGQPKQIQLVQPAAGGPGVSTDLRYALGVEGIWMLKRDAANGFYVVNHPFQFQPKTDWRKMVDLVAAREKVAGGKPVDGLVARSEVFQTQPQPGPTFFEVRFSLKNTTDQPITVCRYAGNKPLQTEWTGPDGQPQASVHYDWLQRARLAGVQERDFVVIPPGGVRYVGPNSPESGVFFQSIPGRPNAAINSAAAGDHQVAVTFVNPEAGKEFDLENVWTGEVTANVATFTAP